MTAIFHYSMQLSMIVFAPHIGAELDWLQLTLPSATVRRENSPLALKLTRLPLEARIRHSLHYSNLGEPLEFFDPRTIDTCT